MSGEKNKKKILNQPNHKKKFRKIKIKTKSVKSNLKKMFVYDIFVSTKF